MFLTVSTSFQTDMNDDMKAEVLEMCVNACEKHTTNNENAAKMIKEMVRTFSTFSSASCWSPMLLSFSRKGIKRVNILKF